MSKTEHAHEHEHAHTFDRPYWETHWNEGAHEGPGNHEMPANPYLAEETTHLRPRTALDAGCGSGAEAIWLAERGWRVTGADISATVLTAAKDRAAHSPAASRIEWVQADLTAWDPLDKWDLVVTNYAHSTIPQLDFYEHLSNWVAPGGTLLIVGHLQTHDHAETYDHAHAPTVFPAEATVTAEAIAERFAGPNWQIETAREHTREVGAPKNRMVLHDVIVRVRRTHLLDS